MKITELLKRDKFLFSLEFFPPKTEESMSELYETVKELKTLGPGYVSVTYGAGGSTRGKTIELVTRIKHEIGIETMAHLTCVGHSKSELRAILDQIKANGIENVIALRGDPPKGEFSFKPHPDGFRYASELTRFIKASYDFCVAVAGYPEGHVESRDRETDWEFLRQKVECGGEVIITQLFFNNADYFNFVKKMRAKGVTVPIVPGIMPITNFSQIQRFTQMCGSTIPAEISAKLEPVKEDLAAVQAYGIEYATRQCTELIDGGAPGIHFYTLNRSKSARAIIENLKSKIEARKK